MDLKKIKANERSVENKTLVSFKAKENNWI